jgi:hypothetical protein
VYSKGVERCLVDAHIALQSSHAFGAQVIDPRLTIDIVTTIEFSMYILFFD